MTLCTADLLWWLKKSGSNLNVEVLQEPFVSFGLNFYMNFCQEAKSSWSVAVVNVLLQGNIRVFSRVRPLIGDETLINGGEIMHIHFPDDDHCTMELERLADANPNEVPTNNCSLFLLSPTKSGNYAIVLFIYLFVCLFVCKISYKVFYGSGWNF